MNRQVEHQQELARKEIATAKEIRRRMLRPAKKIRAVKRAIKKRFG